MGSWCEQKFSKFKFIIFLWLSKRKDVKNLELWMLISWDRNTFDNFYLNFSNAFHDSYAQTKFHFLCRNPFNFNSLLVNSSQKHDIFVLRPLLKIHLDGDQNKMRTRFFPRATHCFDFENDVMFYKISVSNPGRIICRQPTSSTVDDLTNWIFLKCNVMVFWRARSEKQKKINDFGFQEKKV